MSEAAGRDRDWRVTEERDTYEYNDPNLDGDFAPWKEAWEWGCETCRSISYLDEGAISSYLVCETVVATKRMSKFKIYFAKKLFGTKFWSSSFIEQIIKLFHNSDRFKFKRTMRPERLIIIFEKQSHKTKAGNKLQKFYTFSLFKYL